jgi:hypothetical protein
MSWNMEEYERGYQAYLAGECLNSSKSAPFKQGWNDAHAAAIARAKGES